jgi:sugar diacid utilization regulator
MDRVPNGRSPDEIQRQLAARGYLFGLAATIFTCGDDDEILRLAAAGIPAVCDGAVEGAFLQSERGLSPRPVAPVQGDGSLAAQLEELHGSSAAVHVADRPWAWAFALTGLGGLDGYLVVSASAEPTPDQKFLLETLAGLAGGAVGAAMLQRRAADLERRTHIHEVLAGAVDVGDGEEGVARNLHELTGMSVAVEDRFGELRTWVGPPPAQPLVKPDAGRRAWRLAEVERRGRPARDGNLLAAPVAPYGEVLRTVALVDPDRHATPLDVFALEQAARVLAVELIHGRRLADVQLALNRDFVEDLLAGLDDATALTRGEMLGHDLRRPRCVVLVGWSGSGGETLARAVEQAAEEASMGTLLCRRDSTVVLLADPQQWWTERAQWVRLHDRIAALLGSPAGAIGVGEVADTPAELPRSYLQAVRALAVREASRVPAGVTTFEELGIYRILARGESRQDIEQFVREWLGPLLDYDAAHNAGMVQTVAEYCESGGNYDRTARALAIHRSTLRYRLQRIRDISGRDLNNVDARFNLHVAARAWHVLGGGH